MAFIIIYLLILLYLCIYVRVLKEVDNDNIKRSCMYCTQIQKEVKYDF